MRLIALKVVMNWSKNVENDQKLENYLSLKNWLSQEKNRQKVGIYLILILKKMNRAF